LQSSSSEAAGDALETVEARLKEMQWIQELVKDFPRLRPFAETAWTAFGTEPWLVTVTPADPPVPPLVLVVSSTAASQELLPKAASLVSRNTPGAESLGDAFHGVQIQIPPGDSEATSTSWPLYATGLALMLGITVLAAFLLLRDVDREVRTAQLRSHFVASVSHELRTPLTAIRMFAETLALGRTPNDKTRSEYLDTIVNESERLTRLVDNVLDFSKIEQSKKIYHMRPTDLAEVARSAAQAMKYPFQQQGFTLNVQLDAARVRGDADALEQAVLNLLSNAMKYSGDAREVDLSVRQGDGKGVIEVSDRGIGIDPQDQPRVFEKFFRSRSVESTSIAGAGLGLTVVQHIVEAHGGRIECKSIQGKGSTFSICIPLAASEQPI
jgi:signal transduction histidine kinase